jgi:hypothetical protein
VLSGDFAVSVILRFVGVPAAVNVGAPVGEDRGRHENGGGQGKKKGGDSAAERLVIHFVFLRKV